MSRKRPVRMRPWMTFAIPLALVVPIIAGFLLGGPALGFLVALVAALAIVAVAVGLKPSALVPGRRFAIPLVIAVAGAAVIVTTTGTWRIVGWGVLAVAVTVAIGLVFLEIGYSEDRERDAR